MIKVTDTAQLKMLGEQYGEGEFFYPETFLEFEQIEQIKTEAYHAMWDAVQSTYDLYETAWNDRHLFNEAGWRDRVDVDTKAMPNIPREFIKFGHDDARYLRQADPRTHAAMLTNRYSANPKDAPYVGWGLFGALQARANGEQVGNYAPEVRTTIQGRRIQSIRNKKDGTTIPLVMAITKRPIDPNKPEVMPKGYKSHEKWKVDPKTGQKTYSPQASEGEWGPQNGVYTGFADAIEKIETKIGHPMKNRPANKGEVGANLNPPVPRDIDPTSQSYLGVKDPVTGEKLPPAAAGYKPQGVDTSTTFYDALNKWLRGMQQNPEMFDKRYLGSMMRQQQAGKRDASGRVSFGTGGRHGYVPTQASPAPWTKNVAPTTPPNVSDPDALKRTAADGSTYYGRTFVPDPANPKRKVLTRAEKQPWDPKHREELAQHYDDLADELENSDEPQQGFAWWKAVSEDPDYEYEKQLASWKQNPRQGMSDEARQIYKGLSSVTNKIKGFRAAAAKFRQPNAGAVPEPTDLGRGGYAHDEDEDGNLTKRKGEDGDNVNNPITGPVQKMKLPHNYLLLPAPGEPMQLSPEFLAQVKQNQTQFGNQFDKWKLQPNGKNLADTIFAQDFLKYGLELQPNGTFKATKQKNYDKFPAYKNLVYSWASEREGQVEFYYMPQDKEVNMPIYSPGVIDSRKGNNPTILGGIQSAPDGSPELAPMRDKANMDYAMYGKITPEIIEKLRGVGNGQEWKGWEEAMHQAVKGGVATGIKDLKDRMASDGNDRLGQWLTAEYQDMINDALSYCMFNLGNSKALEFHTDDMNRLNMNYLKRMFKPAYAAAKRFDKWYLDGQNYGMVSQHIEEKGGTPPPRKSIEQMSIQEFWGAMKAVADFLVDKETGGEGSMFQVKMKPSHVKGPVLRGNVATQNWSRPNSEMKQRIQQLIRLGVPEDQAYDKAMDMISNGEQPPLSNPDKVPHNPMVNKDGVPTDDPRGHRYQANGHEFNLLWVNPSVLLELFKEARRNYWWFAAKDMVIKLWQSEFKKKDKEKTNSDGQEGEEGGQTTSTFDKMVAQASHQMKNGEDAASVLAGMRHQLGTGYADKGKHTNDMSSAHLIRAQIISDITGKKREYEKYRAMAMKDGSLDNILGMTRAKYDGMRAEKTAKVFDILRNEAKRQGIPPKDMGTFIFANFEKEMDTLLKHHVAANSSAIDAAIADKDNPDSENSKSQYINNDTTYGAEKVMNAIKDRQGGDLNDKGLMTRAHGILEMDPAQMEKFKSEMDEIIDGDDDNYAETYKDIITYHGLDYLVKNADKMDDGRKARAVAFLKIANNYGLHDLAEFGRELLDADQRKAA